MFRTSLCSLLLTAGMALVPPAACATTFTTLYSFNSSTDGTGDGGGSVVYGNGMLYGVAALGDGLGGCRYECGIIFQLDPATGAETVLYHFTGGVDGGLSAASILYQNGILYGVSNVGGSNNDGTIWQFDLSTGSFSTLHSFTGTDGVGPQGLTAQGSMLYGTTSGGGVNNYGVLFGFDLSTGTASVVHAFTNAGDGYRPASPVAISEGTIYGTAAFEGDGNIIFAVDPSTGGEITEFRFGGNSNLYVPSGLTANGSTLYGTTEQTFNGHAHSYTEGAVFEFSFFTIGEKTLAKFGKPNRPAKGWTPYTPPLFANGLLYGVTWEGGLVGGQCYETGCGTIYQVNPRNKRLTTLYRFTGGADGMMPGQISINGSTLYGLSIGGVNALGTVFQVNP
jgi:uncharacterized repeat protein (TIGR03803 family)